MQGMRLETDRTSTIQLKTITKDDYNIYWIALRAQNDIFDSI